jgi:YesN/AraC family two-component response regulator
MIRVLSVDDHPLLREGIAALVNAESDMKLVAEATNGRDAMDKFRLHRPDVPRVRQAFVRPHLALPPCGRFP